jgi:CBS domain containing-hemolysin-like protein
MQTLVIIFLLSAGALCIAAQTAITFLHSRPEKAAVAQPVPATANADADAAAQTDGDDESTRDRLFRTVTSVFGAKSAEGSRLGVLGLVLMLIAVALVIDISLSFTIST